MDSNIKEFITNSKVSLNKIALPDKKSEKWRKIDTKRIQNIIKLPISSEVINSNKLKEENIPSVHNNSARIILRDNLYKDNLPDGINLISPSAIEKEIGKEFKQLQSKDDWVLNVNNATNSNTIAFKVLESKKIELEIIIPEERDCLKTTKVIFVVDKYADFDLLQIITGNNNAAHNLIFEIHILENASVNHGLIAIGKDNAVLLCKTLVYQSLHSKYSFNFLQEGWHLGRIEPEVMQISGHAKTIIRGIQLAKDNEQLSTFSQICFNGPQGSLEQLQKAIVNDKAHSIFNGIIEVPQIAQQTNAAQLSKNLLLSAKAQVDTKPELRIIADDVKCTHGATISQLEEDELFYLQSRGISAKKASELIVYGYAKEITSKMPLCASRWSDLSSLLIN